MFRAYDAGRERLVAVKLFKLDLPPERVHQLVAEFERLIAADLTHPAMAVPLAAGITDVSAYLTMDYVAAESLDLAVREYGPAPAADAVRVAAQLAGALDFAAVVNISHGALHPRDVLLSTDETRMTGVGIAHALEAVGVVAPVRRPYSAPERMSGSAWNRRADVFSLAALIFDLLWGRRVAGTGAHVAEGMTEIADGNLATLQQVFAKALAENPADRYETALEFAESLKGAFPDVSLSEPAPARKGKMKAAAPAHAREEHEPRLPLDGEAPADVAAPATKQSGPTEPLVVAHSLSPSVLNEPKTDFDLEELDIRGAEEDRFHDVETAPAIVPVVDRAPEPSPVVSAREPKGPPPVVERLPFADLSRNGSTSIDEPLSMVERSRSAVWPLVAALLIGLAIGFAGGYGFGTHERGAAPAAETTAQAAIAPPTTATPVVPPPVPAGRESTEVAVAEKPKPPAPKAPAEPPRATPPPSRATAKPPAASAANANTSAAARRRAADAPPAATAATSGSRYAGRLNVESKPAGARVFLDGKLVGTTPLAMPSVAAGEHAIRIERDGYRRWSSSVRIVATEQNRVTASLER